MAAAEEEEEEEEEEAWAAECATRTPWSCSAAGTHSRRCPEAADRRACCSRRAAWCAV